MKQITTISYGKPFFIYKSIYFTEIIKTMFFTQMPREKMSNKGRFIVCGVFEFEIWRRELPWLSSSSTQSIKMRL